MSEKYETGDGTIIDVQTEDGDAGAPEKRFVHGLPADVVALLETLPDIEDKIEDVNSNLGDIHQAVDGVEAKLDTLHADVNPTTFIEPYQKATGTSATQLDSVVVTLGCWVKNISATSQVVYVGKSGVTTSTGFQLVVGEEKFMPCRNTNEVYIIASAASANTSVLPI